ncbi:MAG: adenylyltransferase/cytidyltransferase family protein [Alphaproteobacteria bacterium]|nr:adenylyltransferase/cytidyltransferase family protein [Alphaproteobacteria bacterium]
MTSIEKQKIFSPETAEAWLNAERKDQKLVLCHGVFDLIHPGHIRHLKAARELGDILLVSITPDRFVNKGPGRPAFTESLRAEVIAALSFVSGVVINDSPTSVELIKRLKPDIYAKGGDYANPTNDRTGMILEEEAAVRSAGGRIQFTEDITFSSSELINRHVPLFSPETEKWLSDFRSRHNASEIIHHLESISDCKVLIIGEAIIDEYVFCNGLGKAAKDPILSFLYNSEQAFIGGSLAIANHLGGFCNQVSLLAMLGDSMRKEEFIRASLLPNISPHFITNPQSPTLHKRRFVDCHTSNKMFELYFMDDTPPSGRIENELIEQAEALARQHDIVIVSDYGHGMMTPKLIERLAQCAPFLVVNTQANSGNRGFNTISKWPRADYVCLAGHEAELEARQRHLSRTELMQVIVDAIDCKKFTVTFGKEGTCHWDKDLGETQVPSFAVKVVDRVGAGDAVLAITAPLVAKGVNWEIVGFVANLVGAEMVGVLGNSMRLNARVIAKHIEALLK